MSEYYEINSLKNNTIQYLHAIRSEIDFDPIYQRQSDVWSISKRQLLIDSIINDFDVPKIYFHQYQAPVKTETGQRYQYALVDGKQRLAAIFSFIDGDYALSEEFVLFSNPDTKVGGLTYKELKVREPRLALTFDSTPLDVVVIKTNEVELIEEMFSRLNEAVPLNAAEKRNAFGGPCRTAVRNLIQEEFFERSLPFTNKRYRHLDLAAKLLLWEYNNLFHESKEPKILDVKKVHLDKFFVNAKDGDDGERVLKAEQLVKEHLSDLSSIFTAQDVLLRSVGSVSVFFLLLLRRKAQGKSFPARALVKQFEDDRQLKYPLEEEENFTTGVMNILEYNRLAQSPNDGSALALRLSILDAYLSALEEGQDPLDAVGKIRR